MRRGKRKRKMEVVKGTQLSLQGDITDNETSCILITEYISTGPKA